MTFDPWMTRRRLYLLYLLVSSICHQAALATYLHIISGGSVAFVGRSSDSSPSTICDGDLYLQHGHCGVFSPVRQRSCSPHRAMSVSPYFFCCRPPFRCYIPVGELLIVEGAAVTPHKKKAKCDHSSVSPPHTRCPIGR